MCMLYNRQATKELWEKLQQKGKITVYKTVCVSGNCHIDSTMYYHKWKPGWNQSDRRPKKDGWRIKRRPKLSLSGGAMISHGFHVFLTYKAANGWEKEDKGWKEKIVKFTAYKKDFVAADAFFLGDSPSHAIFARLWLSRKEYDKALGK